MVDIIRRERGKLLVVIILLLPFVLIPSVLSGREVDKEAEGKSSDKTELVLTIKEEQISLNAKNASLKEIIEEIGHQMLIEVVGNISEEEKVTIDFDKLSIEEVLEKLTTNFGYVMDSEKEEKNITKIIVLPKGKKAASLRHTNKTEQTGIQEEEKKKTKRPEPFKFEFDPSKYLKKEEK